MRIRGVVLSYDEEWNQLFIHDGAHPRYFEPRRFTTRPQIGCTVEVAGASAWISGQKDFTNLSLRVVGPASLPAPKPVPMSGLLGELGNWVEIQGQIRSAEASRGRLALTLEANGLSCIVLVMGQPGTNDYQSLVGARVAIRGIDDSKIVDGRLQSAHLTAAGFSDVTLLEPSKIKLDRVPVSSVDALLSRELGPWTNSPIHLKGLIVAYKAGESLTLKDATGQIQVRVTQTTRAQPNEPVNVWGWLTLMPCETILSGGYFDVAKPVVSITDVPSATATEAKSSNNLPVLTRISEIHKLTSKEALRGLPVRVRGVITYADWTWSMAFIQGEGEAAFVKVRQADVRSGQWVELNGRSEPGDFAPIVRATQVEVLGITNLPAPIRVDLQDLAGGNVDSHWVQTEGIVRRLYEDSGHARLCLTARMGKFEVVLPGYDNQPLPVALIDTLVSVQGAGAPNLNGQGQLVGLTLYVPSPDFIHVLEAARGDSFGAPAIPVSAVATFDPDRLSGHRVKVSGTVTLRRPGQDFFLQDASGGIRVHPQFERELHEGDRIEVLGFPATGDASPCLDEAVWRRPGTGALPIPKVLTPEQILGQGTNDGLFVQVDAQLLRHVPRSARPKLVLENGSTAFTAYVNPASVDRKLPDWRPGSVLRLEGICSMQGGEAHDSESFCLLLANPRSVRLLSAPSFWTARNTSFLAGGLTLVILTVSAWVALLRRQVRSQTEVIRQKLEERNHFAESLAREKALLATLIDHLPDNVFVKDNTGHYLLTNRAHTQFHGVSTAAHFLGKTSADLLSPELAGLYAERDRLILTQGLEMSREEEPSKDGRGNLRWLATTKVPLKDGSGKVIGLVGISRDVTERKKAEAELAYERDLLRALLDNVPDSIYFKDLQSRFVRVSRSNLRSSYDFALSRFRVCHLDNQANSLPAQLENIERFAEYLIGKTDSDFLDAEQARSAYQDEQEILRTGQPILGKIERNTHPDGHITWRLTTKMPWRGPDGALVGTYGISKDITSIKEAEARLEELHKELLVTSREAGMAEVATSVLHNVGNVLNSVNVSASLVTDQLNASKVANLARAAGLMQDHSTDLGEFITRDPRGRQLPVYLQQLAEHLVGEHKSLQAEMRSLRENIDHIKTIITTQQNYARVLGVTETVQAAELVEDALRMNVAALARLDIEVSREFDSHVPPITVEKHKVLQILVNLVRNARFACEESGRPDKRLVVRVANGEGRVKITVADNGIGIPAENLTRIFNHGFTTRKTGHGFGLHSGIMAAKEMGGALLASSQGTGQGATFILELPIGPTDKSN